MRYVAVEGGLGNQMFQYAFILALRSKGYKVRPVLTALKWEHENGYELESFFGIQDKVAWNMLYKNFLFRKFFGLTHKRFNGKNFIFQSEALSSNYDFYYGTWQSEKYFQNIRENVMNAFKFNSDLLSTYTLNILKKIKEHRISVSLHVRRGDYLSKDFIDGFGNCCNLNYYQNAIQLITKQMDNPLFVVFSDDIQWCKENITPPHHTHVIYADNNIGMDSWQDMFLMSRCTHNIIANSTFSWWGAYLNSNKDKVVIAPKHWWASMDDDVVPAGWVRL